MMKNTHLLIYAFSISLSLPVAAMANQLTTNPTCKVATTKQVDALFNRWNTALQTVDPKKVVALYAENAVLLPTLSNTPRTNHQEIENYFIDFVKKHPHGKIDSRVIRSGCNWAVDTGLYTFSFSDKDGKVQHKASARFTFAYEYINGNWLIVSHHSSLLPNAADPKENKEEMSELELGHK